MTAWHPDEDYETAQEALGGQSHHELTPGEKAALARAGMASDLEVARQNDNDADRIRYNLSGVPEISDPTVREAGLKRLGSATAAMAMGRGMDEGLPLTEIIAQRVARNEQKSRRY